ncbi:homoserine O-acetyltransferase MetX [Fodinibius sediminis]|uniref:Homoserine O-acetyltransferase n=1 Tax=Fodinibius sediminis TaxID=1214077 RepID=A0A521C5R1_9BACT|nr:homoserine O-acetyltransferase [Fodinibius sediminis]SMO54734.1 homoserine O-acetyltransferase [Fodinibius sediminis]
MNKGVQQHKLTEPFITESGFTIPEPEVAYQTWGKLNKARNNVVLVCHALTGNTAVDEWFDGLFGPGNTLDPERQFIICTNSLGSCYGTSGPASINPETGKPYRIDFPRITIRDMVRMQQRLLDDLEIPSIELVIGGSMGGMQALEWSIMDDRPQAAVFIGMGKAHRPWAIGISHTQRQAIYNDPNWQGGYYNPENPPRRGLALARMIAMISYRSDTDYENKFGRLSQQGDDQDQFQVESYLDYQGQKLVDRFDAVSYVRLSQAMDSHDIARNRQSAEQVLGQVDVPSLVIGIDSDLLYPVQEQHELSQLLPNARYRELQSIHGHDAFLMEFKQMNDIITPFLMETPTATLSS